MKELSQDIFDERDRRQIAGKRLDEEQVLRQLAMFQRGAPALRLIRPAAVGDGIDRFSEGEKDRCIRLFEETQRSGRVVKFLPASGAATRMFKTLLRFYRKETGLTAGDEQFLTDFLEGLKSNCFAFAGDLQEFLKQRDLDLHGLLAKGQYHDILHYLLMPEGLNYAHLPKALLKFHRSADGGRTALEEQLAEAAVYARDGQQTARLHITLSPEHKERVNELLSALTGKFARQQVRFEIDLSLQSPDTDTIAVGPDNLPFRDEEGRLVFRPGGHGALIGNLNRVDADVVFIKNIDNVVPDHLKGENYVYKKVLAGYLVDVQARVFNYLRQLNAPRGDDTLAGEVADFCRRALHIYLPGDFDNWDSRRKRAFLFDRLNRPIRVCGMVKNEGEPGGGPFWVQGEDGLPCLQIVEKAQIDSRSPEQRRILAASSHFNPVDLVCGVRDFRGKKFDLHAFVDPNAYFISEKSVHGKPLKALELPGLWNGAMARWLTLFVEVPPITFTPVKTVNDLLRPEHQMKRG